MNGYEKLVSISNYFPALCLENLITWMMQFGIFPQQANTQNYIDEEGETQVTPMATGNKLTIAPESC